MPGKIPTQYEDKRNGPFRFTNDDLKSPKPALKGLYNAADQAASEQENFNRFSGSLDSKDGLLAAARHSLENTQGTADTLALAGKVGEDTVTHEPSMIDRIMAPIPDAARAAASVGSMLAPEVAIPADLFLGMDAGTRLAKQGVKGLTEHPIASGIDALAMLSGAGRLSRFNKALPPEGLPGRVWGGSLGSEEVGQKMASKQSGIPAVEHYWDALDSGQNPAKAARTAAGRDKGSLKALQSLQEAGNTARKGTDLTSQLDGLSESLSAQEVTAARAKERFGRSFQSESPDANIVPTASSVPDDPNMVYDEAGRALGNQTYKDGRVVGAGDQADLGYAETRARSGNTYGMGGQPTAVPKYIDPISGEAYFDVKGGPANGSTVSAAQLAKLGIVPPEGAAHTAEAIRALRDAAQAKFGGLQRMSPEEAIMSGDEVSKRSAMFGGAGSKQSGSHVRPSKRTPVGAR